MTATASPIQSFFQRYDQLSTEGNVPELVALFADTFLAADPGGARAVTAADFARALPQRKHFFDKIGCKGSELVSVEETPLDRRYTLARTQWRFRFPENASSKELLVESTFLVDASGESPRILLYMAHQDLMTVLREKGIFTQ